MIAEVAVAVPFLSQEVFDYLIPDSIDPPLCVGGRVFVPFGSRVVLGFIIKIKKKSAIKKTLKAIYKNLDAEPVLNNELFYIARKIQKEYFCAFGEAVYSILPRGLKHPKEGKKNLPRFFMRQKEISSFVLSEEEKKILEDTRFLKSSVLLSDTSIINKWKIYAALIKDALNSGKSALFLTPDFKKIKPAVEKLNLDLEPYYFSSALNEKETLNNWIAVKGAPLSFVAGTRSAIFAPVNNLGLIIIDEEDHFAYVQEQSPHYKTNEIAFWRAKNTNAKIVLGCFIPSLESYHYQLLKNKPKIFKKYGYAAFASDRPWPVLKMVDIRHDGRFAGPERIISKIFEYHITDSLQKGEKVLIFVNRKGFSTFLYCKKCGKVQSCPRCSASLVYFQKEKMIVCPICRYKTDPFDICQECKSSYIKFFGCGAQKVEHEIATLFPTAKIVFFDKPVEAKNSFVDYDIVLVTQQFLESFFWHEHIFDSVCVVSCDEMLGGLDFRSTERVFLKLMRLGRIAKKNLCVQTRMSGNYIFKYLKSFDAEGFYEHEFKLRRELKLPPYRKMGALMIRSNELKTAQEQSQLIFEELRSIFGKNSVFLCFEPIPCVPLKARGKYRFQVFFKYSNFDKIRPHLKNILERKRKDTITVVDTNIF